MSDRLTDEQLLELIDTEDYALADPRELVAEVLESRMNAAARRIETDAELQAVARGVIVRTTTGTIAARFDELCGVVLGDDRPCIWEALRAPAEILFDPTTKGANRG